MILFSSPDHFQSSNSTSDNLIYDQSVISSSNEYHCLPSVASLTLDPAARTADQEQQDDQNGSFEDDDIEPDQSNTTEYQSLRREPSIKAYALYDFDGENIPAEKNLCYVTFVGHGIDGCQYANAATISTGECVTILEDDQGDGWTRIEKSNGSTGFVPSSYLRIDSQLLLTQFESNRF